MRRLILGVLLTGLLSACGKEATGARAQITRYKCASVDESGNCVLFGPTVLDLVVRPDAYQDLPLQVRGYLSTEYEDTCLYLDSDSYEQYRQQYAIRLDIPPSDSGKYEQFRGRYVQLEGVLRGTTIFKIHGVTAAGGLRRGQKVPAPAPPMPEDRPER